MAGEICPQVSVFLLWKLEREQSLDNDNDDGGGGRLNKSTRRFISMFIVEKEPE